MDLKKRSQNWKSFDDIIQLSLLQLQYCIYAKNSIKAKDRFNGILQTLLKTTIQYIKIKEFTHCFQITEFLILGKFQLLACHVNNHIIHNKIEAFNNIKTGIQLLYSIVKNFLLISTKLYGKNLTGKSLDYYLIVINWQLIYLLILGYLETSHYF